MNNYSVKKITSPFSIKLALPGSKSITLRNLLLAALAEGESILSGYAQCDDADRMIQALRQLGVSIEKRPDRIVVQGTGGNISPNDTELFLGGSGVSTRFLLSLCAFRKGKTRLDGDETLRKRPHLPLIQALSNLGARISAREGAYLPLEVEGGLLRGGEVSLDGSLSSQFASSLLQVAPYLPGGLILHMTGDLVSIPYLQITCREMERFGISAQFDGKDTFSLAPGSYKGCSTVIEGDASGASYFAALACLHGGEVIFTNLSRTSSQGDLQFTHLCERLGASVELSDQQVKITGPKGGKLLPLSGPVDFEPFPDTAPTFMALAPFIPGGATLTGLSTLKVKESDRIEAPATELKKFLVPVQTTSDSIIIGEKQEFTEVDLSSIHVDTYHDHRIAMSLAVFASKIGDVIIDNPRCVEKTYPLFWSDYERLTRSSNEAS